MNARDENRATEPRHDGPPPVPPPPEHPSAERSGAPDSGARTDAASRRPDRYRGAGWSTWLSPRLVVGLFLAGLGVVLFLEQFGFYLEPVLRWWPVALIAIGLLKIAQPRGRFFGVVLTAIGAVLLIDNLGLVAIDDWDLIWPLAVIAVGAFLIRGALHGPWRRAAAAKDDAASFHAVAVMGGVRRQITSREFVGGEASAVMGGCEVDLRQAEMAGEQAEIEVFAMWGGIELAVPDHWRIEIRGMPVMGAIEDSTRPRTDDASRLLVIRGMALMGAVEIKSQLGKG